MVIRVEKLNENNKDDFFKVNCKENGSEWCNCVAWWCPTWDEFKNRTETQNRAQREQLFSDGEFDGYLLYVDEKPAGWCQVGKRDRLGKLCSQYDLSPSPEIFAVTCFQIAPEYRKKGLTHKLIEEVLADLKLLGVKHIQGFPKRNSNDPWTGPESVFLKSGFQLELESNERLIYGLKF